MKKTQVFSTDVRYVNTEIKKLEADGWEILSVQVLSVASEYLRDKIYTIAYITVQKEEKKIKVYMKKCI